MRDWSNLISTADDGNSGDLGEAATELCFYRLMAETRRSTTGCIAYTLSQAMMIDLPKPIW
jgi:hypothetical protein